MQRSKAKTCKHKKLSLTLSERDNKLLLLYAQKNNISIAIAAKQLIKQGLQNNTNIIESNVPKNQLGIFDTVQIDIFESIDKDID